MVMFPSSYPRMDSVFTEHHADIASLSPHTASFLTLSLMKAPDITENYRRQECHKVSFKLQLTLIILLFYQIVS